jgi:hypothetical protein
MAQINKPDEYFNTVLYTGDGTSSKAITGVGFQPDWVWLKARSSAYSHQLFDVVRGATKLLTSEATDAEQTLSGVTSFDSDGFTVGSDAGSNNNTTTFASWNWLASNTTASNTAGSITSTVSANTTSGFSIGTYTGNGSAGATVGHGLGATPKCFIVKRRNTAAQWNVYHESLGNTGAIYLNDFGTFNTVTGFWNNTSPNSNTFTLGTDAAGNGSSDTYVFYAFAEKKGFSKFGSYTGNGNADGTFVYTGFKPAFVMIKNPATATDWELIDNKRLGYNDLNYRLSPNSSASEQTTDRIADILSNGFKIRNTSPAFNGSGNSIIYMAFAENPLVGTNNIPTTAR